MYKEEVAAVKTGAPQLTNVLLQQNIHLLAPKESFEAELMGTIVDLVHDPGRGSPLSLIEFDNGLSSLQHYS